MLLICLVTIAETDRRSGQGITPAVASENSGSCFAIEGQTPCGVGRYGL
jgi:hypothetical protein